MAIPQHPLITQWYQSELAVPHLSGREGCRVVLGLPLWGVEYVDRFLNYELPSIMASHNHAALETANAEIIIYADGRALEMLRARQLTYWPQFMIWMRQIPDDVMQVLHQMPQYKYTLMSAVHNICIHEAAAKNAGFSMCTADIVYSDRYFERLIDLGKIHDVIVHQALIVNEITAMPELAALRTGEGILDLLAAQLGDIGWRHACELMKSWLINDIESFEQVPGTHFLIWRGHHYVRMHCPHLTPVWLSAAACRAAPTDIGDTLDARFVGASYMPTFEDDMVLISLDTSRNYPVDRVAFDIFKQGLIPFAGCMPQFRVPCMVPTLPAEDDYLPDGVIEQRFQKLAQMLGI